MKKLFFTLVLVSFIFSCDKDNTNEELKLNNGTFNEFSSKLKIIDDFSVPIYDKINKKSITETLIQNINEINEFSKNGNYKSFSYIITYENEKINFKNFSINNESNNESTTQVAYRGAPVDQTIEDMYKCPNGLNLITTCYSQGCVEQAMSNLANNFSSGETISLYHNGLGGVKVCSNVK